MKPSTGVRVLTALLFVASGCGGDDGTKAGGPEEPVELVLTNNDSGSGVRTTPAAGEFVRRVEELSGGELVIRVEVGDWATDGQEIRDVAAGRADLGWTGTRVFDLLGVDELSPLHAPFLIDSYELQAAVLGSDIPDSMLASLARLDVEGLAIFADGLRFPATARSPMLTAEDWKGAGIWLLESGIQAEAVEVLGGTAIHGGDPRQMYQDGTARGAESMWIYYVLGADYLNLPYVTPNVVLSPRTTALFANPESLAGLTDEQRQWIREAAEDATEWSTQHAADDNPGYIEDACRSGARVAFASPEDLAGLRGAVEPVYARLRADQSTAETFAAIEALRSQLGTPQPPSVPDECLYQPGEGGAAAPEPLTGPGPTGEFPLGTYRYELTDEDIPPVAEDIGIAAGVFTWEMAAGEWTITGVPSTPGVEPLECRGWYAVDGANVTFTYNPLAESSLAHCMPPVWTVRWASKDETVIWGLPSVPALRPHFNFYPWERIG